MFLVQWLKMFVLTIVVDKKLPTLFIFAVIKMLQFQLKLIKIFIMSFLADYSIIWKTGKLIETSSQPNFDKVMKLYNNECVTLLVVLTCFYFLFSIFLSFQTFDPKMQLNLNNVKMLGGLFVCFWWPKSRFFYMKR